MTYSEGKIYKLYVTGVEEFCYIGSTITSLEKRMSVHMCQAKSETQTKCYSLKLFEDDNEVVIELLENYPCDTKEELHARERYWIEQFPECLNKNLPGRDWKERWKKNREHNLQKHKEWVANNTEHIAEYNEGRRDISRAQEKARYAAGYKEKRSEAKKVQVECPTCKKVMNKSSLWEHKKKLHPE